MNLIFQLSDLNLLFFNKIFKLSSLIFKLLSFDLFHLLELCNKILKKSILVTIKIVLE